jgi:hypothetical protein
MRISRMQQLRISHQAYNNPELKKLMTSSAHNIKTDHLFNQQHFFFSVFAEGDAQMHAQIFKILRSALRARDHSTAFVHTFAFKPFKRANLPHCVLPYRRADPMGIYQSPMTTTSSPSLSTI